MYQDSEPATDHPYTSSKDVQSLGEMRSLLQKLEANHPDFVDLDASVLESLRSSAHLVIRHLTAKDRQEEAGEQGLRRQIAQFAYGLTHEINNPLANISARAHLLLRETTDPRHQKALRTIVDSSMRAHEMLAEMMLAIQRPALQLRPLDIRKRLNDWVASYADQVADKKLDWQNCIGDDALWCNTDWGALTEALVAGTRNAIDACSTGDTIQIVGERAESTGDNSDMLEIRIAIVDNGPGLSSNAHKHAWDVYYSGREAGRGLGIGLSKLQRIVEGHSGRVWLDSLSGQGCSLEIRIPWYRRSPVEPRTRTS